MAKSKKGGNGKAPAGAAAKGAGSQAGVSTEDKAAMERLAPKSRIPQSGGSELPPELAAIEKAAAENLAPPTGADAPVDLGPGAAPGPKMAAKAAGTQPQQTVSSVLGEIAWMFSMSPTHKYFFLADLEWLVMTPVMLTQFRLFRDDAGKPMGLVLWAYLDEPAEERLNSGATRIRPQDWKCGDRLWVIDVIDLTGGQKVDAMLQDTKQNVFKDTPFKYHRTDEQGRRQTVTVT